MCILYDVEILRESLPLEFYYATLLKLILFGRHEVKYLYDSSIVRSFYVITDRSLGSTSKN